MQFLRRCSAVATYDTLPREGRDGPEGEVQFLSLFAALRLCASALVLLAHTTSFSLR